MQTDLNLHGSQYNVALTVFFISYALLEVPCNIILKMMKPAHWIAIMMFAVCIPWPQKQNLAADRTAQWGVVMTLTGLVNSFAGLVIARFFLGVAESGFFPAAAFLLTLWYKRYEVQKRLAVFYAACSLSGAFGGLLAFAIEKMDGIGNIAGWKWIFIIEGLFPVVCAFFVWFFLPNSPETARFLTPEERRFLVERLARETGYSAGRVTNNEKIQWRHIKDAFKEWRIYALMIIYSGVSIGVYGFTATLPTVINDLGYTAAKAQLMTIPVCPSSLSYDSQLTQSHRYTLLLCSEFSSQHSCRIACRLVRLSSWAHTPSRWSDSLVNFQFHTPGYQASPTSFSSSSLLDCIPLTSASSASAQTTWHQAPNALSVWR